MEWKRSAAVSANNPIIGDLELDETGDLVWTDDLVTRVAQSLAGRLAHFRNTWYLNRLEGIPYFEALLGVKGVSDAVWNVVFTKVLLGTPGIAVVDSLNITRANREINLDFVARLANGYVFTSADNGPFVVALDNLG
jgi:hypothetical protein